MKLKKVNEFFKKNKVILFKVTLFLVLAFLIIPFLIKLLENFYARTFQYTFSFLPYSVLVLALFFAFNKKEILKFKDKINPVETAMFAGLAFAAFSFYLLLLIQFFLLPATSTFTSLFHMPCTSLVSSP